MALIINFETLNVLEYTYNKSGNMVTLNVLKSLIDNFIISDGNNKIASNTLKDLGIIETKERIETKQQLNS